MQHDRGEFRSRHDAQINGLEGFWGYLKRRLAAKGGIQPFRLPLYVAEYVWHYNHRRLTVVEQVHRLMNLLRKRGISPLTESPFSTSTCPMILTLIRK